MNGQPLAKVTGDLDAPRGVDLLCVRKMEERHYRPASRMAVRLPQKLPCAACEGGGCDRCERAGAAAPRRAGNEVLLTLPSELGAGGAKVRVPGEGADSKEDGPGHLIIHLLPADEADVGVRLSVPAPPTAEERAQMAKRVVVMGVGLILLFIGLLRLSGWI